MLFLSDDNTRRGAVSVQPGQVMPLHHGGRAAGGAAGRGVAGVSRWGRGGRE